MTRHEATRLAEAINVCWGCDCADCIKWVASQLMTEFPQQHWKVTTLRRQEHIPGMFFSDGAVKDYLAGLLACTTIGEDLPLTLEAAARLTWGLSAGHRPPPHLLFQRGFLSPLACHLAQIFPGFVWRLRPVFHPEKPPYRATPPWAGPVITVTAFAKVA